MATQILKGRRGRAVRVTDHSQGESEENAVHHEHDVPRAEDAQAHAAMHMR